ncbi:MAG: LacI family DNA-binding transcriptional regulator [Phycisphaerae bacterium]
MAKVTIEDISRQTGLSRGTVSRALNDRHDISQATKQRVLEACRKLNYVPSHAARSLATGRSFAVAVIADLTGLTSCVELLRGVVRKASQINYAVHLVDSAAIQGGSDGLQIDRIDGALVAGTLSDEAFTRFRASLGNRPLVATRVPPQTDGVDVFEPDQAESGRLVARHLVSIDSKAIAYLHRASGGPETDQRLAGFRAACSEKGIDAASVTVTVENPAADSPAVIAAIKTAVAIGATDDWLALRAAWLCEREGRRVGCDVALAGQGNESFAAELTPALTSVDFCSEEIGRRAMETLIQRVIEARQDAPTTVRVTPKLVARASSSLSRSP